MAATAAAAGCFGVASVLQRTGARRVPLTHRLDPGLLLRLARQPPYAAGLALDVVGFVLTAWALRALPLFAVQAGVAASLAVTAVLSSAVLGETPARPARWGVAAAGLGLVLLAVSADGREAAPPRGLVPVLVAGVPALLAAAAVLHRRASGRAGVTFGVLAGVAFAGFAICGRVLEADGVEVRADPAAWALVAYVLVGLLLHGASLQRGAVTTVTAAYVAVEVVVPAGVGIALLGDAPRRGTWGWAVTGFALVVAAVVTLSRQEAAPPTPVAPGRSPHGRAARARRTGRPRLRSSSDRPSHRAPAAGLGRAVADARSDTIGG